MQKTTQGKKGLPTNKTHEDNDFIAQQQLFFEYLQSHIATNSMVCAATGLLQKNCTRYKRWLEKAGRLWELQRDYCQHTGYKATYLTTNPDLAPNPKPTLFDGYDVGDRHNV